MFALRNACRRSTPLLGLLFSLAVGSAAAQTAPALADSPQLNAPAPPAEPTVGLAEEVPASEVADVPAAAALATAAPPAESDTLTSGELRRLNQQWADAMVRNDAQAISQLMAPDYVSVNSTGQILQRPDILRAIADGRAKALVNRGFDYQIRVYGDVGVVMHNTSFMGSLPGQKVSGEYRSTDLYVRRAGRWQLTSSHTTYVAPPAGHGTTFSARR